MPASIEVLLDPISLTVFAFYALILWGSSRLRRRLPFRLIGFALVASFGAHVQAAIFTVGSPSGPGQPCTHGTIQSAISAANSSPGADTIRLTRSLTYQPEANTINTAQELTIEGGYATCTSAADTTNTVVSGTGGAPAPVFTITAPTGAWIRLRRLTISGGDVAGAGTGGGIRFVGDGVLEIQDSSISNNIAGNGGGIYAEGTGSNAELVIGADVTIGNNTARYDGGGVLIHQVEMSMVDNGNSSILNNRAQGLSGDTGYGGGLYVYARNLSSYAYIGGGAPIFGAIYGNHARYGGGVAVGGMSGNNSSKKAELHLFTTNAGYPALIKNNDASVSGGGIHLRSGNNGDITARAQLWNASLVGNSAPDGAAVMVDGSQGGFFSVNAGPLRDGAIPCAAGAYCGRIEGNFTTNITSGAVIRSTVAGDIELGASFTLANAPQSRGILIRDNHGQHLLNASGSGISGLGNALVEGNEASQSLIAKTNGSLILTDSTFAGNTIGSSAVLSTTNAGLGLKYSILWQPGRTTLSRSGSGTQLTEYSYVSEAASLGAASVPTVTTGDPRFVDPAHGDYTLRAGSGAVDYAVGNNRVFDALGQLRDRNLPVKVKRFGVRDLGAFERQSLQPMVLNGDFDAPDLRLWTPVLAGSTTRDTTQNASGAPGSASAHITRTNPATGQETHGLSQCIHLPGPALYALNGWGRGTGTMIVAGDRAQLHWEFRRNGGENCTGAPDRFGWHLLSGSNAWNRPAEPALIEIPDADWGGSPSIKVTLVAVEFGPTGTSATHAWFDGITLDAVALDDVIFANGFEP